MAKAATAARRSDPIVGFWRGRAVFRGASLELGVHFHAEGGSLRAELSCPDFLILDAPLDGVVRSGRNVRFGTADQASLRFHGVLDGDTIRATARSPVVAGVVAQGGGADTTVALVLARAKRPDPPPYETRDARFGAAGSGAVRLAGTLYMPKPVAERHAGVVLLQGSSANRRDDYRFYADHFARAGFAVLAFDKRGAGGSGGDYGTATYEDLTADAVAAVERLRREPGVDPSRVGLWGLSQGSLLAPLVAARVPGLRFLVAVSAPGLPVGECAAFQDSARLVAAGFDAADVRRVVSLDGRLYEWLRTRELGDELGALLREAEDTRWRRASSLPARLPSGAALESWYWRGRTLDPGPAWRAVRVPTLVIHGAADDLMPAARNSRLIERSLKKGGNRDATYRVFPAANHVLRTLPLVAGGPWDWPRAAPGYLELVTTWMRDRVQGNRAPAPAASDDEIRAGSPR
jgi:hypothetical protein